MEFINSIPYEKFPHIYPHLKNFCQIHPDIDYFFQRAKKALSSGEINPEDLKSFRDKCMNLPDIAVKVPEYVDLTQIMIDERRQRIHEIIGLRNRLYRMSNNIKEKPDHYFFDGVRFPTFNRDNGRTLKSYFPTKLLDEISEDELRIFKNPTATIGRKNVLKCLLKAINNLGDEINRLKVFIYIAENQPTLIRNYCLDKKIIKPTTTMTQMRLPTNITHYHGCLDSKIYLEEENKIYIGTVDFFAFCIFPGKEIKQSEYFKIYVPPKNNPNGEWHIVASDKSGHTHQHLIAVADEKLVIDYIDWESKLQKILSRKNQKCVLCTDIDVSKLDENILRHTGTFRYEFT